MYRRRTPALLRGIESLIEGRWTSRLINLLLIPGLIVAALWLPPISVKARFFEAGFSAIGPEGGSIQDPDGTQVTVLPVGLEGETRVRVSSLPRTTFLEGKGGRDLVKAAADIPNEILIMRSPLYTLEWRGSEPRSVVLSIPIPNDSEPYQTLDLYSWDGEKWAWVPSQVIMEDDLIEARLDYLPPSVAVITAPASSVRAGRAPVTVIAEPESRLKSM